jgi:hypothetical protein
MSKETIEIKDYLHLYLGCEVIERISHKDSERTFVLTPEKIEAILFQPQYYKLVLRPQSNLTNEEKSNCPKAGLDKWGNITIESMAEVTNYLRSIKIDCDNLIENNLAIDKTKLK